MEFFATTAIHAPPLIRAKAVNAPLEQQSTAPPKMNASLTELVTRKPDSASHLHPNKMVLHARMEHAKQANALRSDRRRARAVMGAMAAMAAMVAMGEPEVKEARLPPVLVAEIQQPMAVVAVALRVSRNAERAIGPCSASHLLRHDDCVVAPAENGCFGP
jgi:hypothetical protein